jgi:hypothetical protein
MVATSGGPRCETAKSFRRPAELEYDLNPAAQAGLENYFWRQLPQKNCGESDPRACYSIEQFMELMFLRSDTSMLVLSALPIFPAGSPLSLAIMALMSFGRCGLDQMIWALMKGILVTTQRDQLAGAVHGEKRLWRTTLDAWAPPRSLKRSGSCCARWLPMT